VLSVLEILFWITYMTQENTVFVIMPFSATRTASAEDWTETFEHIFRPAIESTGLCRRAQVSTGSLITSIIDDLRTSRIVLADITDQNPNVFYELGVRHALSKRTITVSQRAEDIPSDLRGYWAIVYGRTPREVSSFQKELNRLIAEIKQNPDKSDSPVGDILERDNVTLNTVVQKENAKKLTALHTEITGNLISMRRRLKLAQAGQPIFTSCVDLLLQTLYVDLGADALRNAYELRYSLRLLETSQSDPPLVETAIANLEELAKVVWATRERLIRGVFSEPPTISTLVWNSDAGDSEDGRQTCERLLFGNKLPYAAVPFSMYCQLAGIAGMDREKTAAERLLAASEDFGKRVALVPTSSPEWLYGQCSYKRDPKDRAPFKFVDTVENLAEQRVFSTLKKQDALQAVILDTTLSAGVVAELLKKERLSQITYYLDGASVKPLTELE
jgi:hypothetical protein